MKAIVPSNHPPSHTPIQLSAFSWQTAALLLEGPLRQLFQEISPMLLRAKGFIRFHSSSLMILQFAGQRLELTTATLDQQNQAPIESTLVFIGENLDESWLRLRLSGCQAHDSALPVLS